jgi:hypothetical protein
MRLLASDSRWSSMIDRREIQALTEVEGPWASICPLLFINRGRRLWARNNASNVWVLLALRCLPRFLVSLALGSAGFLLLLPDSIILLTAALHLGLFGRSRNCGLAFSGDILAHCKPPRRRSPVRTLSYLVSTRLLSSLEREGWRSLPSALASICRMRSLVTP